MRLTTCVRIGVVVLAVSACGYAFCARSRKPEIDRQAARVRETFAAVESSHEPKRPAQEGDWLTKYSESGLSYEAYVASDPNRPIGKHTTLYIQLLGDFSEKDRKTLEAITDALGRWYPVPLKTRPEIGLDEIPESARRIHGERRQLQIDTRYVLHELLPPSRPDDAVAVLALTSIDLFPSEDWNFVFGQASLSERVGVWSLARLGNPGLTEADRREALVRALKVATHETGHMFGIPHCVEYECGMNGANSLDEMDRTPLAFCPDCAAKVCWACGAKPRDWLTSLQAFAEERGLSKEAGLWRQEIQALDRAPTPK